MFICPLGPDVDMAPESDRIRYTRHKWNVIHRDHYLPYAAALSIRAMNYQDFVRTRKIER